MRQYPIALFGESEKGDFRTAHYCRDLSELVDTFGEPPPETKGLYFAIQCLMLERPLIFFRVEEEGFSRHDYLHGLEYLRAEYRDPQLAAVGLPGVGDTQIIDATMPICTHHRSLLLLTESDLYDYLTH